MIIEFVSFATVAIAVSLHLAAKGAQEAGTTDGSRFLWRAASIAGVVSALWLLVAIYMSISNL